MCLESSQSSMSFAGISTRDQSSAFKIYSERIGWYFPWTRYKMTDRKWLIYRLQSIVCLSSLYSYSTYLPKQQLCKMHIILYHLPKIDGELLAPLTTVTWPNGSITAFKHPCFLKLVSFSSFLKSPFFLPRLILVLNCYDETYYFMYV